MTKNPSNDKKNPLLFIIKKNDVSWFTQDVILTTIRRHTRGRWRVASQQSPIPCIVRYKDK